MKAQIIDPQSATLEITFTSPTTTGEAVDKGMIKGISGVETLFEISYLRFRRSSHLNEGTDPMCKHRRMCTELGEDPSMWSTHALLSPPQWFRDQLPVFSDSLRAAAEGRIDLAISLLREVRSDDLRNWFVEHGAQSGKFRWKIRSKLLGLERKVQNGDESNRAQPGSELQRMVLRRDGYRCGYCGIGLIPKKALVDFGDIIADKGFRAKTDAGRHGALFAFRANFDHVKPASFGGKTDLSNLVSCCWSCNYGKRSLTLHQVGIEDPLCRQPRETSDWNGLTDVTPLLARAASQIRRAAK